MGSLAEEGCFLKGINNGNSVNEKLLIKVNIKKLCWRNKSFSLYLISSTSTLGLSDHGLASVLLRCFRRMTPADKAPILEKAPKRPE